MKIAVAERRLGIDPGSTLLALANVAEQLEPDGPGDAFLDLWLVLPWLDRGCDAREHFQGTPANVVPFAGTGGDGNHFGFLIDGDRSTEERAIVRVDPNEPMYTHVVAPNLRVFLGLVAVAFGEHVARGHDDVAWRTARLRYYAHDRARLIRMQRLADALCAIPGVALPLHPAAIVNPLSELPRQTDSEEIDSFPHRAAVLAQEAFEAGDYEATMRHATFAIAHPSYRPRALFVTAASQHALGLKPLAHQTVEELVALWLAPTPPPPPGLHARNAIDREELVALVRQIDGSRAAAALLPKILHAAPIIDQAGDWL